LSLVPARLRLTAAAPGLTIAGLTIGGVILRRFRQRRRQLEVIIGRADHARDSREWDLAVQLYRDVLDCDPDIAPIWVQYGNALKEAGDLCDPDKLLEAELAYGRAIALAPDDADHYLQLGHVLKLQGRPEEAQAAYLRAYELNPSVEDPLSELSQLGWSRDRLAELNRRNRATAPSRNEKSKVRSAEWQAISPHFDESYYLQRYSRFSDIIVDPVKHYLDEGWRRGYDPTPWFSTGDYLAHYADVRDSGQNPFYHFVATGQKEGRRPHFRGEDWEAVSREFDIGYYLSLYPDVAAAAIEPVRHYIDIGWREYRDPTPWFSTRYYLDHNPDIREANLNPFLHYLRSGRRERRHPSAYVRRARLRDKRPRISVVVPSYNHSAFLSERLDSILQQSYDNIEILVLDDASEDQSREIIDQYQRRHPDMIRAIYNDVNSGNVFRQWRRGLESVSGELVWICESDDSCERNFLELLIPYFADPSIMVAFGRVQFVDEHGIESDWLDIYRDSAAAGIWKDVQIAPAHEWFRGAFGVRNIIPNVGGCVFRRQLMSAEIWREAEKFHVLGDWFLYAHFVSGGRIAFDPNAVSYFRQHRRNTSVQSFTTDEYYIEHLRIGRLVRERFGTPDVTSFRFYRLISEQFFNTFGRDSADRLKELIDLDEILQVKQTQKHILIAFLGFQLGGAEVFAIHLANALARSGHIVSMLSIGEAEPDDGMRYMVDAGIAVYERGLVEEIGLERFLDQAGIDIVHSHYVGAEFFFFQSNAGRLKVPYVATLHGSYEVTEITDSQLMAFLRGVDYWIYTARKNLQHLEGIPIADKRLVSMPNALIVDQRPFELSRKALKIDSEAVVFGIASRAIREKGWEETIEAIQSAQNDLDRPLVLLLCGTGAERDRLEARYGADPQVRFLGFHGNIHGFYRLCDCAILASRFDGESFPLTLVQALQVGTPVIATDVGEIRSMLQNGDAQAGILLQATRRREALVNNLARAIGSMADDSFRSARRGDAERLGREYDMADIVRRYVSIYAQAANWDGEGLRRISTD
jgi:glycosyltransferase involved in cell wall biosynthesis